MFRFNLFLGSEFDFCFFIFVSKFFIFSKFSISEDLIFWLTSLSNKNSKNNIFSSIFVISKSNASFLGFHEFSKFNMHSRFSRVPRTQTGTQTKIRLYSFNWYSSWNNWLGIITLNQEFSLDNLTIYLETLILTWNFKLVNIEIDLETSL